MPALIPWHKVDGKPKVCPDCGYILAPSESDNLAFCRVCSLRSAASDRLELAENLLKQNAKLIKNGEV